MGHLETVFWGGIGICFAALVIAVGLSWWSRREGPRGREGSAQRALSFLFLWNGKVDRGAYLATGLVGFALKYNIDRLIAATQFNKSWNIFQYGNSSFLRDFSRNNQELALVLLVTALPFIWVGVVLTLKRLRSAGLPLPLVILFFIPIVNLFFFLFLAVVPPRGSGERTGRPRGAVERCLDSIIPKSRGGNALLSALVAAVLGGTATILSIHVFHNYGWTVFVAVPFGMGLLSALLYGYHEPRGLTPCLSVAGLSTLMLGGLLLAVALEGVICLMMAFPIGLVLASIGGIVGYVIQRRDNRKTPSALLGLLFFLPLMTGMESLGHGEAPLFEVHTSLDIQAPPEKVWKNVVAFSEIPPPHEFLFKIGIAYPVRARIEGEGVGAVRHCVFSTGPFVEPIEVWNEPHLLKFSVTKNPPPMQEWTPYRNIHPPHLEGFLASNGGQFRLVPTPGGGTRLEGTTWYRHHMWPALYWKLWSDGIIHRIHLRVLKHIQKESEGRT